jgi:hypothetical protein
MMRSVARRRLLMSISIFFSVDDFYTPWIPRGRDNTRLSPELADRTGTPDKLEVFACTKSSEDPGNGTLVAQPRLTVNAISPRRGDGGRRARFGPADGASTERACRR